MSFGAGEDALVFMAKDSFASGCLFWIVLGIIVSASQDCFGDEEKSGNDKDKNPDENFYKVEVEVDVQGITCIQHGYVYVYEDGVIDRVSMLNDYEIKDKELREKGQRMYEESERLYQ